MMNIRFFLQSTLFSAFLTILYVAFASAQTVDFPAPREQKLLNGLKVLVWNDPKAEKVMLKLRVHSGAAFDPKDKTGVMALLADSFFPTEQSRAFFTEDLEGSLDVSTNYDYIQITATGKPEEVLGMFETIAGTVANPQITDENFKLIGEERLKKLTELDKNPAYVSNRAVSAGIFGEFPYGRSIEGTPDSIAKIERADILFAKERFLTPDNATLTIVGNIKPDDAYRYARRLFGAWAKSDRKIPATFRQPDAVVKKREIVNFPDAEKVVYYQAVRTVGRADKDYFAKAILADVLSKRVKEVAAKFGAEADVQNNSYLLFGDLIFAFRVAPEKLDALINTFGKENISAAVTDADFQQSKNLLISQMNQKAADKTLVADLWLDADTYKLRSVADINNDLQKVTLSDINRVLTDSLRNAQFIEVIAGDSAKLGSFPTKE